MANRGVSSQWQICKVGIYEVFVEGLLEAPKHLARTVHDLYFEPKYEEFKLTQPPKSGPSRM